MATATAGRLRPRNARSFVMPSADEFPSSTPAPRSADFASVAFASASASELLESDEARGPLDHDERTPLAVVAGRGWPRRRPHPSTLASTAARGTDPNPSTRRDGVGVGVGIGVGFGDPSALDGSSRRPRKDQATGAAVPIPAAVFLWYVLGVLSIASSKVLLSERGVPPLALTVQQLVVGMTLLRILMRASRPGGLQPVPLQISGRAGAKDSPEKCEAGIFRRKSSNEGVDARAISKQGILSSILALVKPSGRPHVNNQLFLAAAYFASGFLLTNCGFRSGSAAFVETVKAAEPFTSASVAVLWGIERLGKEEVASLAGIVAGVVLSTLGHRPSATPSAGGDELELPSRSLASKCLVVMLANVCFSFRGLHQKLFRRTPQGDASVIDDLNLQYRMQQIGVVMLAVPTLLETAYVIPGALRLSSAGGALRYVLLSVVNGLAFASYNLASTYVLTRISVVHHAALNCIRRIFAIVVTSIIFRLQITMLQLVGIGLAVGAFFSYINFKMKKETKDRRRKELRTKWGGIMLDAKKSSSLTVTNNGT